VVEGGARLRSHFTKKPTHPITVKNVMSHTSGLPFGSPVETPTLDLLPLSARVRSYAMLPLESIRIASTSIPTPGSTPPVASIEVVSGMPYAQSWSSACSNRSA